MAFRLILVWFILGNCNGVDLEKELFSINNEEIVDLGKIKTISEFEEFYCKWSAVKHFSAIKLPFDFDKNVLSPSAITGIPIKGHPRRCTLSHCCHSSMVFRLTSEGQWVDKWDAAIKFDQFDSLLSKNFLNNGLNPTLSDNPKEALFIIKADPDYKLQYLAPIIGGLGRAYLRFVRNQNHKISHQQTADSFPLHLLVSEYVEPEPYDTAYTEEMEREIVLELEGGT